jgi:hypothetical protein
VPTPELTATRAELKAYEDKLDAVICAWVGICALEGRPTPFGDENSAIWIPSALIKRVLSAEAVKLSGPIDFVKILTPKSSSVHGSTPLELFKFWQLGWAHVKPAP